MNECPGTDAIIAVADALSWNVSDGLRHLQTCDECRARLEVLQLTRSGFMESEPVEPEVLQRISAALGAAAEAERERARERERWGSLAEAVLAGVAALIILVSSGIEIRDLTSLVAAFGGGAILMALGRTVARSLPQLGPS